MTEYETASLAYAALSAWSTFAYAVVSLLVGVVQCLLIWHGIRLMRRAADARDRTLDSILSTQEAHTLALRELVERTAGARS